MQGLESQYLPEQVRQLHKQALAALLGTLAGLAYVVFTVSDTLSPGLLWFWVGTILFLNLYLLIWIVLINQHGVTQSNVKKWLKAYLIQAMLHGLAWGVLPVFLAEAHNSELRFFAYLVLYGMAAASVTVTAVIYRVYALHVLLMLLPGILYQLFGHPDLPLEPSVIALLIIFLLAMLSLAYSHHASIIKALSLAHKNDELVENLKQAYHEAEEANLSKSRFLANMSHELRTPLNAVIGYSEIIGEEAEASGSRDIASDAGKIGIAGKHLLNLIDDILNLSRIEAGKMPLVLEDFDLNDLILRITPVLESLAGDKGNRLIREVAPEIGHMVSDEFKVKQILLYLFTNAAKFTEQGDITLRVARQQKDGIDCVMFDIEDTGIGMSEEQLSMLYDAFRQADDSTTRKYGGMGLGMAITRHYVDMLGGDIEVHSLKGQGSRFQVCLPIHSQSAKDKQHGMPTELGSKA